MKYRESNRDKKLRAWFASDMSHALLRSIKLEAGALRGLNALDISFDYPIAAIAGKNGAGKSTILALACCAFHNEASGFKLSRRKNPYYTFSDFFIQHGSELSPQGIKIRYGIAHNNWRSTGTPQSTVGLKYQTRSKSKGGKWNDYDVRVPRTVVFLGIERIVPHSERSQSRSYSRVFKDTAPRGWEKKVMAIVGAILGRSYDDFRYTAHSKYSLPIVKAGGTTYSGFNMGAGENALFEIFSTVYAAGPGALLVLDEIELGLHAEAQIKLIDALKNICVEMKTQIICTTHSKEIFDCLPSDARFYVESIATKTRVTQGISSEFAFAKLSSITGLEADIFVEDDVARSIVSASLPASIRSRITIKSVGSASALARQLAALYVRGEQKPTLAIFDGDQAAKSKDNLEHAKKLAETAKDDFEGWFNAHVLYLPGQSWPEAWLLQKSSEIVEIVAQVLGTDADHLSEVIEYGQQAGKHCEFFEMAKQLGLERSQCLQIVSSTVAQNFTTDLSHLTKGIEAALKANE